MGVKGSLIKQYTGGVARKAKPYLLRTNLRPRGLVTKIRVSGSNQLARINDETVEDASICFAFDACDGWGGVEAEAEADAEIDADADDNDDAPESLEPVRGEGANDAGVNVDDNAGDDDNGPMDADLGRCVVKERRCVKACLPSGGAFSPSSFSECFRRT